MQGSNFPDGILIDHVALRRTELTKAAEILRDRVDWTSRGMFSGGAITVNAIDLTKIDVALLSGFAPNGEFLETDSNYYSIALNSYVLNAINYVVAVYTENSTYYQPHESAGITLPTCAEMAWRIRVYEESVFNALPATDPNILNDAIDRCIIIGKVTANGPGVNLTTSNIFSPTSYDALLYSDPMTFTTIPGVTVLSVSTDTIPGTGILEHYCLAGPTQYLRWNAPNQAAWPVVAPPGGGWQEITGDMNIDLPGSAGTFLRVQVILSMLPTVIATPIAVNADIYNLYYQEIPRQTAEDNLHRSMIGTGVIAPTNPHGLSLTDLSGSDLGLLNEHQDLLHSNGFVYVSSASAAQATISFPLTADMLSLVPLVGQDAYMCNGKRVTTFAPTSFMFEPAVIPTATTGTHLYEVYLSDEGVAAVHHKAMIDESGGPRTITGVWPVDMSPSYPASAGLSLNLTVAANYTFSFNGGEAVIVPAAAISQVIRLYDYTAEGWLDLLVNTVDIALSPDANLPGVGVYLDNLIVYASPDWTQNIQVASVVGWLDSMAAPPRFAIGYKPYQGGTRSVVDKRARGTLAVENISESALQTLVYSPEDELHESGVLYRRNTAYYDFAYYGAAGLTLNFRGGGYYCRGKRIDYAGSAQTLYDNEINLIYLDAGGTMRIIPVTADFAGSIPDAVNYVIGSTHLTPWVSSVYEGTDLTDSPERGVVLYSIVTAGGAISSYTNLMRNCNGPVYEWSVSSFTSSSALSAFDSLYSAFLYASLRASQDYTIEVILNGPSTIATTITQPASVNVRGKMNSTAVDVTITVADASGAWRLSNGCKISDAQIYMGVDSGAAIGLTNNTTVERCVYFVSIALTNDIFLKSAAACSNVRVVGNKVTTRSSMITCTNASNYNIWVEDNSILQSPNSIVSGLIEIYGKGIFIKNNKLTTDNSITATSAISGTLSGDYLVDGNSIELGTSADAAFNYGIYLDGNGGYEAKIINNTIKRVAGSASHVGIGVYITDGVASILNNTFTEMGGGIWIQSDSLINTHIKNNTFKDTYHFGVKVSSAGFSYFTEFDGVFICGNSFNGMTKNAGGVALFGTALYGIYSDGFLNSDIYCGNCVISDNTFSLLSSAVGNVVGIFAAYESDSSTIALTAGWEGFTIDRNSFKIVGSTNGYARGISVIFQAPNGGHPSTLTHRGISVCGNSVREIASTTSHAYGIRVYFDLHNTHTSTLLNGLKVNDNSVSSFAGLSTAPTLATTAGIHIENADVIDQIVSSSCSNNTIGTTSVAVVVPGTANDATFVYGLYSNLESGVISGNSITISGTTARGDGIRAYPTGAATAGLVKLVVSNNAIDVPWTGIHLKGVVGYATASVNGNRITSGSVGIYLDARVLNSAVVGNDIFINGLNSCEYAGCTLDGYCGIVGNDGDPANTTISANNISVLESANLYTSNIYLNGASSCSVDGNRTQWASVGAAVGTVRQIVVVDCGAGATSVSSNTVDNSQTSGAGGISVLQTTDNAAMLSVLNNRVLGLNVGGGPPWEIAVNIDALLTKPTAFVFGNVVQVVTAGIPNIMPVGGTDPNVAISMQYDNVSAGLDVFGNVMTSGVGGSFGVVGW